MSNFKPYKLTIETDIIIDTPKKEKIYNQIIKNVGECHDMECRDDCPFYRVGDCNMIKEYILCTSESDTKKTYL